MESNEIKKIIPFDDIWDNLNVLEKRLLEVSSSSNDYLTSISQYLINAGGKRFRPIVTSLAGKFGNEIENISKIIDAGVCVELIHIGSLYHDDVMDNATTALNEFRDEKIIGECKDIVNQYFNKSIESIYGLKSHELFPVLENINNFLMNRSN